MFHDYKSKDAKKSRIEKVEHSLELNGYILNKSSLYFPILFKLIYQMGT